MYKRQTFTTPYLNLLAPFSTLRFMDWASTNGNPVTKWSQRTPPDYASQQQPNGAAWEYAIQLCNTLGKDMWVNVPVGATDGYVTSLAKLIHKELNPNLNVYVEFSNEVWNSSFAQFFTNLNAAEAEVKADKHSPLDYDGDTDIYDCLLYTSLDLHRDGVAQWVGYRDLATPGARGRDVKDVGFAALNHARYRRVARLRGPTRLPALGHRQRLHLPGRGELQA